jgi:hypothetical protein
MGNNHIVFSTTFSEDEPKQLDSTECENTESERPWTNG